jgi:2-isopropylmalate synthase
MTPQSVGIEKTSLTLGKLSGRSAFKDRLKELGYDLSEEISNEAFLRFKNLADKKKEISNEDLMSLIDGSIIENQANYQLLELDVDCGNNKDAKIFIKIRIDSNVEQVSFISKDGPVDAIFSAIDKIIPRGAKLELYKVEAVTEGTDAQANVLVRLKQNNRIYSASGASTNVLVASAIAYINCLEKLKNH